MNISNNFLRNSSSSFVRNSPRIFYEFSSIVSSRVTFLLESQNKKTTGDITEVFYRKSGGPITRHKKNPAGISEGILGGNFGNKLWKIPGTPGGTTEAIPQDLPLRIGEGIMERTSKKIPFANIFFRKFRRNSWNNLKENF